MEGYLQAIQQFITDTHVFEQFQAVDVKGLFTNRYFLIPFIAYMAWLAFKQAINNIVIVVLILGLWIFSGSSFMQGLFVDGHLQIGKVLPVAGIGVLAVAVAVYFIFIRSD